MRRGNSEEAATPLGCRQTPSTTIAIVGAGPWGLAVLDRLIARARRGEIGPCEEVVLIDRQPPGVGVHSPGLSPHLLLNTMTEQVDAFGAVVFGEPPLEGALDFRGWLEASGMGDADPCGFVPRRLYGCYLGFVYQTLRRAAAHGLRLQFVQGEAVDICRRRHEVVMLDTGASVNADLVFLCTGHGVDAWATGVRCDDALGWVRPYPTEALSDAIDPGATVGVAGLGLVAVDVVASLTEGREGRFIPVGNGCLEYVASGAEPIIHLFSRNGLPFCCRPNSSLYWPGGFQAALCTPEAIANRRLERPGGKLDFERDVLPLLFDEMAAIYRARSWPDSTDQTFDPKELFYDVWTRAAGDATTYRSRFLSRLCHDIAESAKGEAASPYKAAIECFRLLRDTIRESVEFGGLTSASHLAFRNRIAPRINQIAVGPPVLRGKQLVALIEAGVARLDLGPAPLLEPIGNTGWIARSRSFDPPVVVRLDALVRGFVENSESVCSDRIFKALKAAGRSRPAVSDDGTVLADVEVSRAYALVDSRGQVQDSIRVLGLPSEGTTYFNHYLPSPGSRSRAFRIVEGILDGVMAGQV